MPIDARERERVPATLPACRAVVAARLHAPDRERAVLRRLRVRGFSGDLLDDPRTIAGAAREAGVDTDALDGWLVGDDVGRALGEDLAAARDPAPAARALDHKLAGWDGGRRYTCPSYELEALEGPAAGMRLSVPGFHPVAAYEAAVANLVPEAGRREDPQSVEEVLAWAGGRWPRARSPRSAGSATARRARISGASPTRSTSAPTASGRSATRSCSAAGARARARARRGGRRPHRRRRARAAAYGTGR